MRTTVTLNADLVDRVRQLAAERGISFKEALNRTVRDGLAHQSEPRPFRTRARPLGLRRGVDLTKALRLAGELEDEEIVRKLEPLGTGANLTTDAHLAAVLRPSEPRVASLPEVTRRRAAASRRPTG